MCYRSDMSGSDAPLLCLATAHYADVGSRDNVLEKITTFAAESSRMHWDRPLLLFQTFMTIFARPLEQAFAMCVIYTYRDIHFGEGCRYLCHMETFLDFLFYTCARNGKCLMKA